jgi:hypothetical protein
MECCIRRVERDWWSNESSLAPWPLWTDVVVNPSSGIFSFSLSLSSLLLLLLSIDSKPIALLVFPHSLLPAQSLSHPPLYFQNLGASICLVRVHFSSFFSDCYFQHAARVFANVNINQQPAGHYVNVSLAVNWPGMNCSKFRGGR